MSFSIFPTLPRRISETFRKRSSLLHKAAIMAGARGLGMAFGALGSIWAARCLGPRNFGISGMVQSLAALSLIFIYVVYPLVLIRDYKNAPDNAARNHLIQVTNGFRLMVSLGFCGLAAVVMGLGLEPAPFHFAGWFFIPILFLNALQPTWIFQAAEKQHFQSLLAILQPLLLALYYVIRIRPGMSAGWDLLGITLISAVLTFIYWKAVFKLTSFQGPFFLVDQWGEAWNLMLESRWLFLSSLAIYVYNSLDQPLLGWLNSLEEQGKYRTAVRVTDGAITFLSILPNIFFPRFIEWRKQGEEFFWKRQRKMLLLGGAFGGGLILLSFFLIPFAYPFVFGPAYVQAARPCAMWIPGRLGAAVRC